MIKGEKTGLRAIEVEDLEMLRTWRNKPEFRRYFREYRELNAAQQRGWFDRIVNGDDRTRMFAAVRLSDGALLGACGLCYIDWVNKNADFSIYIGLDDLYIDTDLAPDMGRTLMRYGFEELNLHRIWAEIYDFDHAKVDLFATLGFVQEGRHRQTHWAEGAYCDSLFYSVLRPEFLGDG